MKQPIPESGKFIPSKSKIKKGIAIVSALQPHNILKTEEN